MKLFSTKNLLLLFCFVTIFLEAKPSIILRSPEYNPGFFSVFMTVIGAIDQYDQKKIAGLQVNFGKEGHYYDSAHGDNWWNYYFQPVALGKGAEIVGDYTSDTKARFSNYCMSGMSRKRANELIKKYIRVKKCVSDKVSAFYKRCMKKKFVIGVHYRGTDKYHEAPVVAHLAAISAVRDYLAKKKSKKPVVVFVATDDAYFLHLIQQDLAVEVVSYDALRSTTDVPVHLQPFGNGYKKGEDALIDALLLANCDFLIKCASNLSDAALLFNPDLSFLELNKKYQSVQEEPRHRRR